LAPQPSLGLGLLHKIRLNFLEASQQFSFLQVKVVSSTPNPHPGGISKLLYFYYICFLYYVYILIEYVMTTDLLPHDDFIVSVRLLCKGTYTSTSCGITVRVMQTFLLLIKDSSLHQ
jgi:hypothetical protein